MIGLQTGVSWFTGSLFSSLSMEREKRTKDRMDHTHTLHTCHTETSWTERCSSQSIKFLFSRVRGSRRGRPGLLPGGSDAFKKMFV